MADHWILGIDERQERCHRPLVRLLRIYCAALVCAPAGGSVRAALLALPDNAVVPAWVWLAPTISA